MTESDYSNFNESDFEEYYVNEEIITVNIWAHWIDNCIAYSTFIIKLLIFIFFVFQFIKKTSNVCNIYFYLLFVGFSCNVLTWSFDISFKICDTLSFYESITYDNCYVPSVVTNILQWYNAQFSALWTLLLTINRLTAIVWFHKYDEIWTKCIWKALILLLAYPFLLNGYSFFNYKCRFLLDCKDPNYWMEDANVTTVSSGIIAILSLITAIITAVVYRLKIKKDMALKQSPDRKLVFQAIITSFTYVAYSVLHILVNVVSRDPNGDKLTYLCLGFFKHFFLMTYHLSAFVLVFVFSPTLRKELLLFYNLTWLVTKGKSKTKVIQISFTSSSSKLPSVIS